MAVRERGNDQAILELVRRTFLRHGMVVHGDTVVVGVSGGLDSVSLLDILARLKVEYRLRLVIAHVHHGLRPAEGDREFRFVEGLASRYEVPFEGRRIEASSYVKGANVQAQARRFRVRFFEEVAREWGEQDRDRTSSRRPCGNPSHAGPPRDWRPDRDPPRPRRQVHPSSDRDPSRENPGIRERVGAVVLRCPRIGRGPIFEIGSGRISFPGFGRR